MVGDTAPKRFRLAVDALAVLTFVALVLSAWAFYTRFSATNDARINNRAVWHKVVCHIESETVHGQTPPYSARVARSLVFFDSVLVNDVGTTGCGLIGTRR